MVTTENAISMEAEHRPVAGWKIDLLLGIVPLLALSPMLAQEFRALWERPHLRMFALPIVTVVILLFWSGALGKASVPAGRQRRVASLLIFVLNSLLMFANMWMLSPWIAHAGLILYFIAWGLMRWVSIGWPRIVGWASLLVTGMRFPSNLDTFATAWFEGISATLCEPILDALAVPGLRLADVISLRESTISVSDSSWGFFSINAFLFMATLLVILEGRSLAVGVLSLLTLPLWIVTYNLLLLLSIVLFQLHANLDVSRGKEYAIVTIVLFSIIMASHWLVLRFLAKACYPVPAADSDFEPEFQLLNALICWPQTDPYYLESELPPPTAPTPNQVAEALIPWHKVEISMRRLTLVAVVLLAVAGVASVSPALSALNSRVPLPEVTAEDLTQVAQSDLLPEVVRDLRRIGYSSQLQRNGDIQRGVCGWRFEWQGQVISLEVIFPFEQTPDLTRQYLSAGWRVLSLDSQRIQSGTEAVSTEPMFNELKLENDLGGKAYLWATFADMYRSNATSSVNRAPLYQIQMFCESGDALSRAQILSMRQVFQELAAKLRPAIEPNFEKLYGAGS
jgi:hypothetical protein